MYKIFVAIPAQFVHQRLVKRLICEFLPAVCDNIIFSFFRAAAQVKHKMLFSNFFPQCLQTVKMNLAFCKYIGSNYYVAGTRFGKMRRIFYGNTASDLQSSRYAAGLLRPVVCLPHNTRFLPDLRGSHALREDFSSYINRHNRSTHLRDKILFCPVPGTCRLPPTTCFTFPL